MKNYFCSFMSRAVYMRGALRQKRAQAEIKQKYVQHLIDLWTL